MLIGVDFDNTIVCYDALFYRIALQRGLIPPELPAGKDPVRHCLRQLGKEDAWTELQGYVYGVAIKDAPPFDFVLDFFRRCRRRSVEVRIISHKTRWPFRGPRFDLHEAAKQWLSKHGFFDPAGGGLSAEQVCFEVTREGKLDRIGRVGCSHFIDDLPEFLAEPGFPEGVERILFDPNRRHAETDSVRRGVSWKEIDRLIGSPDTLR